VPGFSSQRWRAALVDHIIFQIARSTAWSPAAVLARAILLQGGGAGGFEGMDAERLLQEPLPGVKLKSVLSDGFEVDEAQALCVHPISARDAPGVQALLTVSRSSDSSVFFSAKSAK